MKIKAIYDNGGKTFDQFTVIFADNAVLGLSHNPDSPQGFSQWSEAFVKTEGLGYEVAFEKLPENIRRHIRIRTGNCEMGG